MNKFSPYKLFYNELVYKQNTYASYKNIGKEIDNIKEYTINLRRYSKYNIDKYMKYLDNIKNNILIELNKILKLNKDFFLYYKIIYDSRVDKEIKIEDIPSILVNSLYEDYRLDNKSLEELETSNRVIPKYNSSYKLKIVEDTKNYTKLEYFIKIIKELKRPRYKEFLDKSEIILNIKPLYNESHYMYFERLNNTLTEYKNIYSKLEDLSKQTDDYEIITDMMKIAFHKNFYNFNKEIELITIEYFDYQYKFKNEDEKIKKYFMVANRIDFEEYESIIIDLKIEKENLDKEILKDNFEIPKYYGDNYLIKFKEKLINDYYNKMYYSKIIENNIQSYLNKAMELYILSKDIEVQVLDYYLYEASHSKELNRNNDVYSAIINKIYELYNPLDNLKRYDLLYREYNEYLDKENRTFIKEYHNKLLLLRDEYNFKGVIPSISNIKVKIYHNVEEFIINNSNDIKSLSKYYDTRNYDLILLGSKLPKKDILELDKELNNKIFIAKILYYKKYHKYIDDNDILDKIYQEELR